MINIDQKEVCKSICSASEEIGKAHYQDARLTLAVKLTFKTAYGNCFYPHVYTCAFVRSSTVFYFDEGTGSRSALFRVCKR